jgi:hypothetical protein
MTQIQPAYCAHQRRRWMRPDAFRFVRPNWRRFVRAGFERELPFDHYERKYSPDQPRVPAGNPYGGQWTSGGGGGGDNGNGVTTELSAAGHHHIPKAIFEKYPFPPETRAVFEQATTGTLRDPSSNWFDREHRAYNDAVKALLDRYLETNGIDPRKMTPDQARAFIGTVLRSPDLRIKNFIRRMKIRELRRFIFRRMRGAE